MENNQINYVAKKGMHIPKDVKEYILKKVKEGGKSVPELSKEYGISKAYFFTLLR